MQRLSNRKKHIKTCILAVLLCCILLTGCGAEPATGQAENGRLQVVTTIFPQYDFTRAIAGDLADITMLLPPGSESHTFEPTPQDIIRIQNCDIFIYGGGESDAWADTILASMDTSNMTIISLMDIVSVVEEEFVEGMQAEDEHDEDEEAEYDEHVWTAPQNAKIISTVIAEALKERDSANAGVYESNRKAYSQELDDLDAQFRQVVTDGKRNLIVFGDRFPFRYFADAYGLKYYAAFPGCASETEPSAATVAFLIDTVKEKELPVIFHIEFSNESMADTISEGTGAKKLLLHSCHNVSQADIDNGVTYLQLMQNNVSNLKEALN